VICTHGLTDFVKVTDKTTYENYEDNLRMITYGYFCNKHGHVGTFSIQESNVVFDTKPTA
jgi:hypothetical protein